MPFHDFGLRSCIYDDVFASRRALHLRLFCTPGTPVLKTLDFRPSLPIVMQNRGYPALHLRLPGTRTISWLHPSSLVVLVLSASPSKARSWQSFPQSRGRFRNWKTSFFCLEIACV